MKDVVECIKHKSLQDVVNLSEGLSKVEGDAGWTIGKEHSSGWCKTRGGLMKPCNVNKHRADRILGQLRVDD